MSNAALLYCTQPLCTRKNVPVFKRIFWSFGFFGSFVPICHPVRQSSPQWQTRACHVEASTTMCTRRYLLTVDNYNGLGIISIEGGEVA